MQPRIPSIDFSSVRDAGSFTIYSFSFTPNEEQVQLATLLRHMRVSEEVSVPLPDDDGALEVRRTGDGYERKKGRHGSYGTWMAATFDESVAWLLPGALYATKFARRGYGGMLTCPHDCA